MEAHRRFVRLARDEEQSATLAERALMIAAVIDPRHEIAEGIEAFGELASSVEPSTGADLAMQLFGSGRFRGNVTDYYAVENSLLPEVLATGVGIPITLSVLFIEVGRRHGLTIEPVGMPGHFLTKVEDRWIDPFHAGVSLDHEGCEALYSRLAGRPSTLPADALVPVADEAVLQRILWNLRSIAEGREDAALGESVLSLLAAFDSSPLQVRVSWASLLAARGRFDEAAIEARRAAATASETGQERLLAMATRWEAQLN